MIKPQTVLVAVIAVAVIAVLAYGMFDSEDGNTGSDPDGTTGNGGSISVGPFVDNIDMGSLIPVTESYDITDPDNPTITYRAVAREGFQFLYWTDSEGNFVTDNPSMTFAADEDRDYTAHFDSGGTRSIEIQWYMPIFNGDGSVTFGNEPERLNVSISSFDWYDSLESDIQRGSEVRVPSPVALLTDDGVIADIVEQLRPYTEGLTNLQKSMVILAFVQDAIDYETDWNLYDEEEFWATPMESLFLGYGDCEDGATLFVSIASAMGVDCGFVTFDSDRYGTDGTGHMSIAVALEEDEAVTGENVATFVVDGVTYAYGETAVDPSLIENYHPMFGILGESYSITDGTWTHIVYSDGTFTAESTLSIGNGERSTGGIVYGDSYSDPPAVPMRVGDGFAYTPETTLPATYVVTGDGLVENGGFLTWDDSMQTLSGTATKAGTYTVILTATSTVGPTQTAVQTVTLIVEEASVENGSSDHYLIYGGDSWTVETEDVPFTEDSNGESEDHTVLYIVGGALAIILGIIIVGRVI